MAAAAPSTNLLLRIRAPRPDQPDQFPIEISLDGGGSLRASVRIPFEELIEADSRPWEYGRRLGASLFSEPSLRRALSYARGKDGHRVAISIEVDADATPAHSVLWERLIFSSGDEEEAFAASSQYGLSRLIPSETPALPAPGDGPLRLLLVVASPVELATLGQSSQLAPIDTAAEIANLRGAWDSLVARGLLRVKILGRIDAALADPLREAGYDVAARPATLESIADFISGVDSLHLICHGAFRDGKASLLLEDSEGRSKVIAEDQFLPPLGKRSLRLVFLQACQSATRSPGTTNVFSGLAPKVARVASAVVAMQDYVLMDDAKRFAQEFYETLLTTGSAHSAVNAGRRTLYRLDSGNWAIPALFLAPRAEPLWQADAVLSAVHDVSAKLHEIPDVATPFPIEVIRLGSAVSFQTETSPPGARVRLSQAIAAEISNPESDSHLIVIAGHNGRAKTAQLYSLYTEYAAKVSRGGPLPFLVRMSHFEPADVTATESVAKAISKTFGDLIDGQVSIPAIAKRLSQPFVLFLDGDQETDNRRRTFACENLTELIENREDAFVVATLDQYSLDHIPALALRAEKKPAAAIFLVQLMTPASVGQFLHGLPSGTGAPLLHVIEHSNLFDLATVPWLLSILIRQPSRSIGSRSQVIERVVNSNFASVPWTLGARRIVQDLLGNIAWTLQTLKLQRLTGSQLYELLDETRGRREVPLEQLRNAALETRMLAPTDEDGVRFAYPGFQSFWCAKHLLSLDPTEMKRRLDDVTATLGRWSRVRLWEDTLVLLTGLMDEPDQLLRRILSGNNLSVGEQTFLAARCINEAHLCGKSVASDVSLQVLDSLILRSSNCQDGTTAPRVRAAATLGLLRDPQAIPHLLSLAIKPTYIDPDGNLTFHPSGVRQAALQVLMTMQKEAEAHIDSLTNSGVQSIPDLIEAWRANDSESLKRIFFRKEKGLPAIAAFALAAIGEDNLEFLAKQILDPSIENDTMWAIADAVLFCDPRTVASSVVAGMRRNPALHLPAAYILGRLGISDPGSDELRFLDRCLHDDNVRVQGVALRSLAQLGQTDYRELAEWIATGQGKPSSQGSLRVPKRNSERNVLRRYALESLRLIGTLATIDRLRESRNSEARKRDPFQSPQLNQLSYEISEAIYWRVTGGLKGDFYDLPPESPAKS